MSVLSIMEETFGHIPVQYVHLPARNRSGSSASPIKMGYRVIGEGAQKILFIMGFRSSHLAWAYQAQYFAARPEYQLCVFDNRGCGFTDSPYGRYTTSMLAEDAYTLVQGTLGWEKFHLVGVSMGGMISLELASRYPQHIISLSLLVTHAGGFRSRIPLSGIANITHERHKEEEHENLSRRLSMIYTKENLAKGSPHKDRLFNFIFAREAFKRKTGMRTQRLTGVVAQTLTVFGHYVSRHRLLQLRYASFPVLLLASTEDHMVRTSNMCYLRSILGPRARFVRLNTGHGINTERPDQVNPILERHFDDGFDKASSNINENENENENGHEHGKDYDHIDDATMKNEQMRPTSSSSSSFDEQCMHTLLQGCNHNGSCFINISRGMVRGWISIGQVYLLIFLAYHLYSYLYNDYYTNRFYSTRNTGLDSDNRSVDDASYFLHERLDQWKRSFRAEGILLFTLVGLAVGIGRGLFRSILCVYRRVRMVKQWRKQHPIGCRCEHIHNHRSAHENIDTRRRLSPQRLYRALPSPRETVESCTARYTLHYPQVASFFAVCNLCMFYMLLRYLFL